MGSEAEARQVALRAPKAGDFSWLMHRHMATVAPQYGWDERYEAHLAEIVAGLLKGLDSARERFWVAERGGEVIGSVGVTRESDHRARLRLMFVEPEARGLGLGRRLGEAAVAFAREAGYAEMALWTVSVLTAARALYADLGFRMISQETSELAASMCDETWLLKL
jgi:GNAT superfamily N-acetyltransferase